MLRLQRDSPLVWILGLALLLRISAAVAVHVYVNRIPDRRFLIEGDANGYWELSRRIAAGEEFALYEPPRRVMRMPGFPILLVLSGGNLLAARLILAVVGTAGCYLVYRFGRELVDETTGLVAAGIVAVSPSLIVFSVMILSETAFAVAMTLSLLLMTRLWGREENDSGRALGKTGLSFFTGVCVSAACYMRPSWLLFGPLFVFYRIVGQPKSRTRWMESAVLLLGMAVALAPWTIRNHRVTDGRFVVTTLWVGPSLYDGLNPDANGDSEMSFFRRDSVLSRMSEYEMDRHYRRKAWIFMRENPGRSVELGIAKLARYWSPRPNAAQFQRFWVTFPATAFCLLTLVPALLGIWLMRGRFRVLLFAAGPVLYFAGIHSLFVGSIRYRLPAEYALAVLSAVGWLACYRRFRGASSKRNT